jgi:hypothetical protein
MTTGCRLPLSNSLSANGMQRKPFALGKPGYGTCKGLVQCRGVWVTMVADDSSAVPKQAAARVA